MIILSQDKNHFVNYDTVTDLYFDDGGDEAKITVRFVDGNYLVIGEYQDKIKAKEIYLDLMMDYRGNALIKIPQYNKSKEVKL